MQIRDAAIEIIASRGSWWRRMENELVTGGRFAFVRSMASSWIWRKFSYAVCFQFFWDILLQSYEQTSTENTKEELMYVCVL